MSTTFDPAAAAALLGKAMTTGERIKELPESARPASIAQGYAIQDHLAAASLCGDLVGDKVAGWKLGLGSVNAMKGAGLDRPLIGRVYAGRLLGNGATVVAPAGAAAMIEIEVAFTLARDVLPTEAGVEPRAVIAKANLVSEIVLSRFVDRKVVGLPSFAADSVGFHALVIGPEIDVGSIPEIAAGMAVDLDGKPAVGGLTGDDAIDPETMLGYLMAHARDRGITLRKGEIVTTGTLSKPFDAAVPATIAARTPKGGVHFKLSAG